MREFESPNHPFTALITLFREGLTQKKKKKKIQMKHKEVKKVFFFFFFQQKPAPDVVIYDNACHLQEYCLARAPRFFKNTLFLVDRLHWENHTGCSMAHNICLYPFLSEVNTQAAEQLNSGLTVLRKSLPFMKGDNFILHLKLFILEKNRKKKENMENKK